MKANKINRDRPIIETPVTPSCQGLSPYPLERPVNGAVAAGAFGFLTLIQVFDGPEQRSVHFHWCVAAVLDRYYLSVCAGRAFEGALVVISLISRFNTDKEHWDAAFRASPHTHRSLFSTKTTWPRHSYSPTN